MGGKGINRKKQIRLNMKINSLMKLIILGILFDVSNNL